MQLRPNTRGHSSHSPPPLLLPPTSYPCSQHRLSSYTMALIISDGGLQVPTTYAKQLEVLASYYAEFDSAKSRDDWSVPFASSERHQQPGGCARCRCSFNHSSR